MLARGALAQARGSAGLQLLHQPLIKKGLRRPGTLRVRSGFSFPDGAACCSFRVASGSTLEWRYPIGALVVTGYADFQLNAPPPLSAVVNESQRRRNLL